MKDEDLLYYKALKITQANEALYDQWENAIAAYMEKKWPKAFIKCRKITGSESVTTLEVADMGGINKKDWDKFLDDLYQVFRTLAKGCQLSYDGEWS